MSNGLIVAASSLFGALIMPGIAVAQTREVLPTSVVPLRYDVHLTPNAAPLTYTGEETVTLDIRQSTPTLTLNAKELKLDQVTLDGQRVTAITPDAAREQVTFILATTAAKGQHKLHITWHGKIASNGTTGLFAMDYNSSTGVKRTLATNLEPAQLRTFLPSWDEPDMKAVFSLTLDAPADQMAIANMPVAQTTALAKGEKRVRFIDTPMMSTYLFFFTIGDYERIHKQVAGVDLSVVVKRGDVARAQYAMEQASQILPWYNSYFGVAFPLPKLDLIAAPGNIAGGAMENWGANFYGQEDLLFDPAKSTESDRQEVFSAVAHEMAHQWFGDLVTMRWWDNLWLNEGFARWMQTYAADALHPEWRTGLKALDIYETGKAADSKPSTHPVLQTVNSAAQAQQAFDNITYEKGAAVINMLIGYAGQDALRGGVRAYMKAHAYGNTVDSELWSEVQKLAGKPVLGIEQDFTQKAGLPLVRVTQSASGSHLSLDRFVIDPSEPQPVQDWHLPLNIRTSSGDTQLVLDHEADLNDPAPLVNAGANAYARVLYDAPGFKAILSRYAGLNAIDQYNLLNDAAALANSGYASVSRLLDLVQALPRDSDPLVWSRALSLIGDIDQLYGNSPERLAYRAWALRTLAPVAARAGDTAAPGEDAALTSLRSDLFVAMAEYGDDKALARAKSILQSGKGSADDQQAAMMIVARKADTATFDTLLAKAYAETDPLRRKQILMVLGEVEDPALNARFITQVALGTNAPAGSAAYLVLAAIRANPETGWQALAPHLDDPNLPIDSFTASVAVPIFASYSADPGRIDDLQAYADKHIPADARQRVEGAKAGIRQNVRAHGSELPDIKAWIAAQAH